MRAFVEFEVAGVKNMFCIPLPGCCVHALHLVMNSATRMTQLVGDVHALAYINSQVGHHNTILQAFHAWVDEHLEFVVDEDADPAWGQHTRRLCSTLLGWGTRMQGSLGNDCVTPSKDELDDRVNRLCQFVNGDIRDGRPRHFERQCGKCSSRAEAAANFAAACIDGRVLLRQNCTVPSKNRWGTCYTALAEQSLGIMIHTIMPQVLVRAFPRYVDGEVAQGDPHIGLDIEERRKYLRNKVWRAKCTLNDSSHNIKELSILWAGFPLARMWHRLEFLDQRGAILLDLVRPSLDPFLFAQQCHADMLMKPSSGSELDLLWHQFSRSSEELCAAKTAVCSTLVSIACQVWWRFQVVFSDWPFRLVQILYADPDRALQLATEFMEMPECCLEPLMASKVRALFNSPEEFLADKHFWSSLRLWASSAKLANMHIERMLALVRQSLPLDIGSPLMERVCASGLLAQFSTRFTSAGGRDPRVQIADDLVSAGVPLQRAVKASKKVSNRGGSQPWMLYANEQRHRSSEKVNKLTRDAQSDRLRDLRQEFDTLPPAQNAVYVAAAAEQRGTKRKKERSTSLPPMPRVSDDAVHSFGTHSHVLPLDAERFVGAVLAGTTLDETCSFRSWGVAARHAFQESSFVKNAGAIPQKQKFKKRLSCCQAHPGICVWHDEFADLYLQIGRRLLEFLFGDGGEFAWFRLECSPHDDADAPSASQYAFCGHVRAGGPRMALMAIGASHGDDLEFQLDDDHTLVIATHASIVKRLLSPVMCRLLLADCAYVSVCKVRTEWYGNGSPLGRVHVLDEMEPTCIFGDGPVQASGADVEDCSMQLAACTRACPREVWRYGEV
jgi:hypothetical protein